MYIVGNLICAPFRLLNFDVLTEDVNVKPFQNHGQLTFHLSERYTQRDKKKRSTVLTSPLKKGGSKNSGAVYGSQVYSTEDGLLLLS
jgi:hypothetical protein